MTDQKGLDGLECNHNHPVKILIVEDEEAHIKLIKRGFSGCQDAVLLSVAMTVGGAKTEISRDPPDLILLDTMMEPMDGWDTLLHIRGIPGSRDIPVVMLTGKDPTMSEAETYGPMMDDYLMKPYLPRQFETDIRQVLARADHLHTVIRIARDCGVDNQVVSDFQRFASTVWVLKKLKEIISPFEIFNDDVLAKEEGRFTGIKEQITRAGVQV